MACWGRGVRFGCHRSVGDYYHLRGPSCNEWIENTKRGSPGWSDAMISPSSKSLLSRRIEAQRAQRHSGAAAITAG
jgi:hypothetical protein